MIYLHRATFDEMDYAQVAFFGRHNYWLEHATTAWLMQHGIGFAVLTREYRIGLPATAVVCRYRAPVTLEQTVEIRLAIRDLSRRGFTTLFEIVRQDDGVLVAHGSLTRRAVDLGAFRGIEVPDDLWERFQAMAAESEPLAARD
jgi:YbgC/YbaW family acyl-CoA thioester hydrolase